jgi:hypothetical protein
VNGPAQSARTAAEAVRALNHVTFGGAGYARPGEVDQVIGELLRLAERLPQALRQAGRFLAGAHAAGRVGHDSGPDATDATVAEVLTELGHAQRDATFLATALRYARDQSSHLTGIRHDSNEHDNQDHDEDQDGDGGRR